LYEQPDIWVAAFTGLLFVSTALLWNATDQNAKAALKAANVADDALKTIERAFVFVEGFDVELTSAADAKEVRPENLPPRYQSEPELFITRFALLPRWKNSGSTPTRNMTIQVNAGPLRRTPDPTGRGDPMYDYGQSPVPMTLGPGAIERSEVMIVPGIQALIDWSYQPVGPEPLFLIWGTAVYEDAFDRGHHITWCYRIRLDRHDGKILRAGFIQWGSDHNGGDG
jgi:hypothetical protein